MPTLRRSLRPSPAFVIACLALFVALGGVGAAQDAYVAAKKITAKRLANNAVTSKKIAKNAVTSTKIKDGSILFKDIKKGEIPEPAALPAPAAPVDAYTKTQSDGRYTRAGTALAAGGKAVDADKLDGSDSTAFMKGTVRHTAFTVNGAAPSQTLLTIPGVVTVTASCPASAPSFSVDWLGNIDQAHVDQQILAASGFNTSFDLTAATPDSIFNNPTHVTLNLVRNLASSTEVTEASLYSSDDGSNCRFSQFTTTGSG